MGFHDGSSLGGRESSNSRARLGHAGPSLTTRSGLIRGTAGSSTARTILRSLSLQRGTLQWMRSGLTVAVQNSTI
jgi:hypothetical protein